MGLKKYLFFSLLLLIIIAGYVFSLNANDYRIEFLDNSYVLPIAIWLVVPAFVIVILSFLHMLFYGTKSFFEKNALKKDLEKMAELLKSKIVKQEYNHSFKTPEAKELASILNQLDMTPSSSEFLSNDKNIQDYVSKILKISSGDYIPSKELKLPNTNHIMERNLLNKLKVDSDFCLDVVKKPSNYSSLVVKKAISTMIENKSITTIKKNLENIQSLIDKELAFGLFEKDSQKHETFSLAHDDIRNILHKLELNKSDFIKLAKIYKKSFGPDEIIKFFEDLSSKNEDATSAYLYVLFEYEMLDSIREILSNSSGNEYIPFKALLDLKESGKHYRLETLCLN